MVLLTLPKPTVDIYWKFCYYLSFCLFFSFFTKTFNLLKCKCLLKNLTISQLYLGNKVDIVCTPLLNVRRGDSKMQQIGELFA